MKNNPIGIFDSGLGGLTIWKELHHLMPFEDTIYLADSKNAPYGDKTQEEIRALSVKNTEYLLKRGCKIIVVACNTATTNAIAYLRSQYEVPFVGIEPAIKPAALHSKTGTIGVLATKGTLSSDLFYHTASNHASDIKIMDQEGTGLVALIEAGKASSPECRELLGSYLQPMWEAGIDHLVLGCTHYPLLIPVLSEILPENVTIVDCGGAVARQIKNVLQKSNLVKASQKPAAHDFYTNGSLEQLQKILFQLNAGGKVYQEDF